MRNKNTLNYYDYIAVEAAKRDNETFLYYVSILAEMAINSITWEGLPPEIDARFMEMTISYRGHALFFRDDGMEPGKEFICLPCTLQGKYNNYNIPINRRAYAANGYHWNGTEEDSVVIFNNRLRHGDLPVIKYFASKLTECERSIDVNIRGQKTPKVIATTKNNELSITQAMKQYDGNMPVILTTKALFNDGRDFPTLLDLTTPYKAGDLQMYKRQLFNEAQSYFGIENLQTDKKERQITDEVATSLGYINLRRFARLNPRLEAADQINRMYGLNLVPKFNNFVMNDMVLNAPVNEIGEPERGEVNE